MKAFPIIPMIPLISITPKRSQSFDSKNHLIVIIRKEIDPETIVSHFATTTTATIAVAVSTVLTITVATRTVEEEGDITREKRKRKTMIGIDQENTIARGKNQLRCKNS